MTDAVETFYAMGDGIKAAQADLAEQVAKYKAGKGLKLTEAPTTTFDVTFFKGDKPGKASLQANGPTFEEAVGAMAKEYGLNPEEFNKHVKITAAYPLTEEDQKAAKKVPPPSAGGITPSGDTLEVLV
jgi:hypothetical protein